MVVVGENRSLNFGSHWATLYNRLTASMYDFIRLFSSVSCWSSESVAMPTRKFTSGLGEFDLFLKVGVSALCYSFARCPIERVRESL